MKFHSIEDYGGADSSHALFRTWGWDAVTKPEAADIIVFNGGTDIATEIYGEKAVYTSSAKKSIRDIDEMALFDEFKGQKLLLGICRGSQLLNCLNGGKLWQDVNNHGRTHQMLDRLTGEVVMVTSTHHQMMIPNLETGSVIGVASESTIKRREAGPEKFDPMPIKQALLQPIELLDVEIVWYRQNTTLCIQGHPEYVPGSRFAEYSRELILKCYNESFAKVNA
jgi:carbamoylphosphate synthase small subunit